MKKIISKFKGIRDLYLVRVKWRKHSISKRFHAGKRVWFGERNRITIGTDCYIGRESQIGCDATLGNYVMFGNRVALVGRYDHNYQQIGMPSRKASHVRDSDYHWKGTDLEVKIEDDVWIGYGSVILSGVSLGQGSIIAAGSVVTRDVEPFTIYGGVPAKKIADRFNNESDLNEHIRLYKMNYNK